MLSIRTNIGAVGARRRLSDGRSTLGSALAKQLPSEKHAVRNASKRLSVGQTAVAALNEVTSVLIRMRDHAMRSASDSARTNERSVVDRGDLQMHRKVDRLNRLPNIDD